MLLNNLEVGIKKLVTKNYNISDKKLEPIKNNHKPVLKEINEISKKLEPLNKNYLKLQKYQIEKLNCILNAKNYQFQKIKI